MPAEPSNSETPPPTTPNRWRRRASRLWWWMLPGMIATIVVLLGTLEWRRRGFLWPATRIEFPTSALTSLGWTPAGRVEEPYGFSGNANWGRVGDYLTPTSEFSESLRTQVRKQFPGNPEFMIGAGAIVTGYGLPVPWLMQCDVNATLLRAGENQSGFDTPTHRFILGLIPVAEEGDMPALPARRVSPFVYDYLTYYPDPLGFLLNTVIFSTLWTPITSWYRRRKARYTNCTRCGYSREGLAQDSICPECGQKPVH